MDIRIYILCIAILLALLVFIYYIRKIEFFKQLTEENILTVDVPNPEIVSDEEIKKFVDNEYMAELLKEYVKVVESTSNNFRTIVYIKNRIKVLEGKKVDPEQIYFKVNVPKQSFFSTLKPY